MEHLFPPLLRQRDPPASSRLGLDVPGDAVITVVIADDHSIVRDSLRSSIEGDSDFEVVGEASDGAATVALIGATQPDVVALDLRMPGAIDGWGVLEQARSASPTTRILVVSAHDDTAIVERALTFGAAGYASKRTSAPELLRLLRAAARGETAVSADLSAGLLAHLGRGKGSDQLSAREREILVLLAAGSPAREIAATLHLGEPTVRTHIATLKSKLHAPNATAAAVEAIRRGLID